MTDHLNFMLLGIGNGAVFAALAVALVMVHRSSGVLNFATGALALHAAYTYAYLRKGELLAIIPGLPKTIGVGDSWPFWPALLVAVAIEAVIGVLLYLAVFRPLRNRAPAAKAVASLGVMTFFVSLIAVRAGEQQVVVAPIFPRRNFEVLGLRFVGDRLFLGVTIVAIAIGVAALYRFSRFGLATRAASESEVGALVSGLSPERIAIANWALSSAVAAVAGILIAPLTPLLPATYTLFVVPALAAAVLGNFSAVLPAAFGGLAIGMLQSLMVYLRGQHDWMPDSGSEELVPLVIVLVLLVVRGRPLPDRGAMLDRTLGRVARPTNIGRSVVIAAVAGLAALLVFQNSYRAAIITGFIFGLFALSLVVVTGYLGQISLAQVSLGGAAAFLLSHLTTDLGVPFPIAPLLAAAGAAVLGVVIGLPALRIRGLLVAVVTLMLAVALEAIWFRNPTLSGGAAGGRFVEPPQLFGLDLRIGSGHDFPRLPFGIVCLVTFVAVGAGVAWLRVSRLGSAMLAVRANERAAASAGISVVRVKLLGFAIASFIAGLAGCLLAYYQPRVTFASFSSLEGIQVFGLVFLAGITMISGSAVAAVITLGGLLYIFVDRSFELGHWYGVISGLGMVFAVITNPEGIAGAIQRDVGRLLRKVRGVTEDEAVQVDLADTEFSDYTGDPAAPGATLAISDLSVSYGGVLAVDRVSLEVPRGEIVGLIGPNGAGKTTLMDAMCGFAASTGTVRLDDDPVGDLAPHRRAQRGVGRTFQALDLYDDLTVRENVVVGQATGTTRSRAERDAQLGEILELLGITDLADRRVSDLSQGHRQLVSIGRALAGAPRVLLLDEPAAGLDSAESQWLARRLRNVRDSGVTILLVDHDMQLVLNLCDRIHVLDFGVLIASGTPAEVRDDPRVAAAYLGAGAAGGRAATEVLA